MGALYGILGDAGSEEIRAIGERLVHRGDHVCEWSVGPLLRFGMRSSVGALERLAGGPITFDGVIDNRREVSEEHRRGSSPLDDAATVLELFHRDGVEAFARIAGQFAVAISASNGALTVGRDRIGYAPLYFTLDNGRFLFAS